MDNFIYVGYDVWDKPRYSADFTNNTTWERNEIFDEIKVGTNIEENFLQLLNPKNKKELNYLFQKVITMPEKKTLILVAIQEKVYHLQKKLISSIEPTFIDDSCISLIGYDVCDINGFFSIFDMGIEFFTRVNLLDEKELEEAFNIINLANDLVPEHSPFYIVKLYEVQREPARSSD